MKKSPHCGFVFEMEIYWIYVSDRSLFGKQALFVPTEFSMGIKPISELIAKVYDEKYHR